MDLRTRLVLLGTGGGPTPKPNRAAPAQAIVAEGAVYIVDCGNGVARQLVLANLPLGALRAVFLTHHHSDHNADFGNLLLLAWAATLKDPVRLVGPPPLAAMWRAFLETNAIDIAARVADEGRPPLAELVAVTEIAGPGEVFADDKVRVSACLVEHPPIATALAYRFDTACRSIALSGDTRPSPALIDLARGAEVLVHEVLHPGALADLLHEEAHAAGLRAHLLAAHTTTDEVGGVATSAGVKRLVLTHFVPGGPPIIPDRVWYDAVRPHFAGELIVGADLMEI